MPIRIENITAGGVPTEAFDPVLVANELSRLALASDAGQFVKQVDDESVWLQTGTDATLAASWERIDVIELKYSGSWVTGTAYLIDDLVSDGSALYRATADHTASALFATDAANWEQQGSDAVLKYTGSWVTGTAYLIDDLVSEGASLYRATADHTAAALFATDAANWEIQSPVEKDRVHADATTVGAVAIALPTLADIAAFALAGSHTDVVMYYTGDDLPASDPTHVYHVDASGAVTLLQELGGNIYTADGVLTGARAVDLAGNALSIADGVDEVLLIDESGIESRSVGYLANIFTHITATAVSFDTTSEMTRVLLNATSTGDMNLNAPGGIRDAHLPVRLFIENEDVIDRTVIFDARMLGMDGVTAIGTVVIPAGHGRWLTFRQNGNSGASDWVATEDSSGVSVPSSGATIFATAGDIAARDAITGMVEGDLVKTSLPQVTWRYDGAAWVSWDQDEISATFYSTIDSDLTSVEVDNFDNGHRYAMIATAAGVDLNVGFPQTDFSVGTELQFQLVAIGAFTRNFVFDPVYKDQNGTAIGTIAVVATGASAYKTLYFERRTIAAAGADEYWLVGGTEYQPGSAASPFSIDTTRTASFTASNDSAYTGHVFNFDGAAGQTVTLQYNTAYSSGEYALQLVNNLSAFELAVVADAGDIYTGPATIPAGKSLFVTEDREQINGLLGVLTGVQDTIVASATRETLTYTANAVPSAGEYAQSTSQANVNFGDLIVERTALGNGLANVAIYAATSVYGLDPTVTVTLPTGTLTTGTHIAVDRNTLNTSAEIIGAFPAADQFSINRDDNIGGQSNFRVTMNGIGNMNGVVSELIVATPLVYGALRTEIGGFTGVDTQILYPTTDTNAGGAFAASVFTAPVAADYEVVITGNVDLNEADTTTRNIHVTKNNPTPADDAAAVTASVMNALVGTGPTEFGVHSYSATTIMTLAAGETLSTYFKANSSGDQIQNGTFVVKQLPTSTTVVPDTLPVVDNEELVFTTDTAALGDQLAFTGVYADLAALQAEFEKIRFVFGAHHNVAGLEEDWFESTLHSADLKIDDRPIIQSDASSNNAILDIVTSTLLEVNTSGTYLNALNKIRVYGIRAQKTVINVTDAPVDDQAASGYFDVGNMRMQWGVSSISNVAPIALPAPFADTTYTLTGTCSNNSLTIPFTFHLVSKATTFFNGQVFRHDDNTISNPQNVDWIAIGLKP